MNLDDFGKVALQRYIQVVEQHNALVAKTKAVESKEKFAEAFMNEALELSEFNAQIEKLESALEDLKGQRLVVATPLITPAYEAALAGVGVDPEQVKELKKQISASAKYLTSMYGDAVLADAPKPDAMRAAGGSTGGGGRRIRGFEVYVDGVIQGAKNADGVFKSTFSHAAKALEVETVELQRAFFEAAGQEDTKADSFPALVEFEFKGKTVRAAKVDDSGDSND